MPEALREYAVILTGSPKARFAAMLSACKTDLIFVPLRGEQTGFLATDDMARANEFFNDPSYRKVRSFRWDEVDISFKDYRLLSGDVIENRRVYVVDCNLA